MLTYICRQKKNVVLAPQIDKLNEYRENVFNSKASKTLKKFSFSFLRKANSEYAKLKTA